MKRFLVSAAALAVATAAPLAADATPWQPINQRQATLERRLDEGVRSGQISRPEAAGLRSQFRALKRLEAEYRRSGGGLSARERADLDSRFDRLSHAVKFEKHDHRRG